MHRNWPWRPQAQVVNIYASKQQTIYLLICQLNTSFDSLSQIIHFQCGALIKNRKSESPTSCDVFFGIPDTGGGTGFCCFEIGLLLGTGCCGSRGGFTGGGTGLSSSGSI